MDCAITVELMRHAKTIGNLEHRYVGWTNEEILPNQNLPVIDSVATVVFGSDLLRCRQTASCYFPNAEFISHKGFRESRFGDFEYHTYDELKNLPVYRDWLDDPYHVAPPNGENLREVMERSKQALLRLPDYLEQYRIVLHGGTIRSLLIQFAPTASEFWDWHVSHDEVFRLQWSTRKQFEEGLRCTSLSVVPITANEPM